MKERILQHIQTVSDMRKANLPCGFIGIFREEMCNHVSAQIIDQGICNVVGKMSPETRKYFVKDPGIAAHLSSMTADGTELPIVRLESMFRQAQEEILSEFAWNDIKEVLMDHEIPDMVQFYFLKYFKHVDQTSDERLQLLNNLEKYVRNVSLDMAELTREERNLLFDPMFMTCLLDGLLDERETWLLLMHADVLQLLKKIAMEAHTYLHLHKSAFSQMTDNPGEIKARLERVLECFSQEQHADFINLWVENDALLADLKRLERVLPDLDEERKKEMLEGRVTYVCTLYQSGLDNIDMAKLSKSQEEVLLYAMLNGKRHFLKLVNENYEDFTALNYNALLLDPDIYRNYLNLNTLNEKNLRDCFGIKSIHFRCKEYLNRKSYIFEELQLLAPLAPVYFQLYGFLTNERSDDRLRIFREFLKNVYLPNKMEEGELRRLADCLSQKPLSKWMQKDLGHIRDLKANIVLWLLIDWEDYQRFIPEIENERQVICLIRNRAALDGYETLEQFQNSLLDKDEAWLWLKKNLPITDDFMECHEERIRQFVYDGEAEIVYQFCRNEEHRLEEMRRLVSAELLGEFDRVKYHEADLEKEIAYPISEETERIWKENLTRTVDDCRLWEEDRFIPVLQIGEIPMHTCISYRDGMNKDCLLSCFDANKKVLYLKKGKQTVFRALLRLTKGSKSAKPIPTRRVEFADLTKSKSRATEDKEELILFLERPYFSKISKEKENEAVSWVYQMVQEKAKKLHARVVISQSYEKYEASRNLKQRDYYVYISASKNGNQYLDSLGGEATVSRSGLYGKNRFLMMDVKTEKCAA